MRPAPRTRGAMLANTREVRAVKVRSALNCLHGQTALFVRYVVSLRTSRTSAYSKRGSCHHISSSRTLSAYLLDTRPEVMCSGHGLGERSPSVRRFARSGTWPEQSGSLIDAGPGTALAPELVASDYKHPNILRVAVYIVSMSGHQSRSAQELSLLSNLATRMPWLRTWTLPSYPTPVNTRLILRWLLAGAVRRTMDVPSP